MRTGWMRTGMAVLVVLLGLGGHWPGAAAGQEGLLEPAGSDKIPNMTKLYDFAQKEGRGWAPVTSVDPLILLYNKEGTVGYTNTFAVPKSAKNKELAYQFINFYLDAAQQEAWARVIYYGPTNREVRMPPEYRGRMPVGSDDYAKFRFPDEEYLAKARGAWVERWNKEIYDAAKYQK